MSIVMDEKEMRALAGHLAKNIKTEKDLSDFSRQLKKMTVEVALGAEMEEHLGYAKHDPEGHHTGSRGHRCFNALVESEIDSAIFIQCQDRGDYTYREDIITSWVVEWSGVEYFKVMLIKMIFLIDWAKD